MSQFTPNLNRDGIDWEKPVGTWKQEQDVVHLETFAEKLVIPPESANADILNSIPTPWSRLLLFESALYNNHHPSHAEVLSQWRGLLGLLALAKPLEINLAPSSAEMIVELDYFRDSPIAKTFTDLRPRYFVRENNHVTDVEAGKWNKFHLITVDNQVLGATSPRTLVFTGISHQCPPSVPFRSETGRLEDPLNYYKRFRDGKYLTLLQHWLNNFINGLRDDSIIANWLGNQPAAPNTTAQRRHDKLLGILRAWQNEINLEMPKGISISTVTQFDAPFTSHPYDRLLFLPRLSAPPDQPESHLLLKTEKVGARKVVVCYRPDRSQSPKISSSLYNSSDRLIQTDSLKIWNGRWIKADSPLPERIDYLPADWDVINDPVAELFEDKLIEVKLARADESNSAVYHLTEANLQKDFLFPFKERILQYFEPEEIYRYTKIEFIADRGYRITLDIPLHDNRKIKATRIYEGAENEFVILTNNITDHQTSELVMWPDFKSKDWNYYYYFKRHISDDLAGEIDFTPVSREISHTDPADRKKKKHWYFAKAPVSAFIGTLGANSGLLLPKYQELREGMPDYWNVAVDFGSTHTRVFYLKMERGAMDSYKADEAAEIEPLSFTTYAKPLTALDDLNALKEDFFALDGELIPPTRAELKTLLMKPVDTSGNIREWSPREGFGYLHWIYAGFDNKKLKSDIKWEGTGNKGDLSSYLRWLMIRIQAEAAKNNAKIVEVLRSIPTAFGQTLKADHTTEWMALSNFTGLQVQTESDEILSEAVATARYLVDAEGALEVANTISFDVGGSTTDIAIWYGKKEPGAPIKGTLGAQESIKMAAGIMGKYLQTNPQAAQFLKLFATAVNKQGRINISFENARKSDYALLFYNTISVHEMGDEELQKNWVALIEIIKGNEESRGLLAHIIYLFGSLVYYSGLLTRRTGLQNSNTRKYYLYFCGKGGTLITWIKNHEILVKKLFIAGLLGPDSKMPPEQQNSINVDVKVSRRPKEEVGRGLLAKLAFKPENEDDSFGLYDLKPPSVTAGETGYKIIVDGKPKELKSSDELKEEVLLKLDSNLPPFDEMKELNHFIKAISEAFKVQDTRSPVFDFNRILRDSSVKAGFADVLLTRFFGEHNSVLQKLRNERDTGALVEPLLITEMKVLLEFLSGNDKLFE